MGVQRSSSRYASSSEPLFSVSVDVGIYKLEKWQYHHASRAIPHFSITPSADPETSIHASLQKNAQSERERSERDRERDRERDTERDREREMSSETGADFVYTLPQHDCRCDNRASWPLLTFSKSCHSGQLLRARLPDHRRQSGMHAQQPSHYQNTTTCPVRDVVSIESTIIWTDYVASFTVTGGIV